MKKTSIIILLILIITGLFVACNGDAANSVFGEEELPNVFCFTALEAGSTVKLELYDDPNYDDLPAVVKFLYSIDNSTWADYTIGTPITLANVNDKVYFKAKEEISGLNGYLEYYHFTGTGKVSVQGNIMYLLDPSGNSTEMEDYAFTHLFKDNTALVSAKDLILPSETLSLCCYFDMFCNCTSLTDAPELNATVLGEYCYNSMFFCCTSLTKAPDLLATNLVKDCYNRMFYGCSSLAIAPVFDATVKNNLKTESFVKTNALEIFKETKIPQSDFNAKCFAQ